MLSCQPRRAGTILAGGALDAGQKQRHDDEHHGRHHQRSGGRGMCCLEAKDTTHVRNVELSSLRLNSKSRACMTHGSLSAPAGAQRSVTPVAWTQCTHLVDFHGQVVAATLVRVGALHRGAVRGHDLGLVCRNVSPGWVDRRSVRGGTSAQRRLDSPRRTAGPGS